MKWIETILLRSAVEIPRELLEQWKGNPYLEAVDHHPVDVKIYRNYPLDMDVSIHIRWESETRPAAKSFLGNNLCHIMKDYGLVCHSVWIEEAFEAGQKEEERKYESEDGVHK